MTNVSELIASVDIKGEDYTINAIENGYLIKFSFRQKPSPDDKGKISDYWDYKTKTFVFNAWSDLVSFLGENALAQPPK